MRTRWQGVSNIVRFNAPVYVLAMGVVVVATVVALMAPSPVALMAAIVGIITMLLTAGSLWASYVSYDSSGLYEWQWLRPWLPTSTTVMAHVHTGLDESTTTLRERFPGTTVHVFDASDTRAQTEPSIARARAIVPLHPDTIAVGMAALPLPAGSVDVVLLPMAAHEVRDDDTRAQWFNSLASSLRPGGRMLVIEHLRDARNAMAFHIGVLHFLSRATWLNTFRRAGLVVVGEQRIATFLWVFALQRSNDDHTD
jgi:SAM-dependent methyltransferase